MSTRTTHTVIGMTCDHCVRAVRNEVAAITGGVRAGDPALAGHSSPGDP